MRYDIRLKNCAFFARHGVLAEEKALGQRFYVDANLSVEAGAALRGDEIAGTVHYGEVFALIERIVTGTRRNLIETLAHDLCEAILAEFEAVATVEIVLRKPSVPIAGLLDHAEIAVRLERSA